MEPGPVRTGVAARAVVREPAAAEIKPLWDAFMASTMGAMVASAQSADECAAHVLRAATDAAPALRYMTHPPQAALLLRAKVADLDGAAAAAALLSTVQRPAGVGGGGGGAGRPAERDLRAGPALPGGGGGGVDRAD